MEGRVPHTGRVFNRLVLGNFIPCSTVIFRRRCIEQVGLFDTTGLVYGCEDWDMWLRISREYEFAYVDKCLAGYRVHSSNMSRSIGKMAKGQLMVLRKVFENPGLSSDELALKNKAYSSFHLRLAEIYYTSGDLSRSRREILRSLRYDPFSLRSYVIFIKSLLGHRALKVLRDFRDSIAG